jgi:tetratricopeptide (TPR) repeat protein
VAIARACDDKAVLAQALYLRAAAINDPTTLRDRLAVTDDLVALADQLGLLETRWTAAHHRFGALLEAGDIVGAEQMLGRLKELAPNLRQVGFSWATSVTVAMMSVMRGVPAAEEHATAAFELGTAGGQPDARSCYLSQLSVIRRDQGRYGELVQPLIGLVDAQPHLPVWRVILAGLYCETDQLDEARAQMRRLAAGDFEIALDWTWASAIMSLGQVCRDIGDRELAARFYPQLRSVAGQVGVTGISIACYGSLALPCGLLAACLERWDEAEQYFSQALTINERLGARPYLVRTRRAFADMLLDRDGPQDAARAATLIAAARGEATQVGMRRELVRLDRLQQRVSTAMVHCGTETARPALD